MSLYASKKKRARKKRSRKPEPKKLARKAKKPSKATKLRSKKTSAAQKASAKRSGAQRASAKRAAKRKAELAARRKAERKAELARAKRNAARREARAEAKRVEQERLAKLAAAREKRNATRRGTRKEAIARVKEVEAKQQALRLENEKLRLPNPKTTKAKKKKVRAEVNQAVKSPPIVVEFTQAFDNLFEIARKSNQLPRIDYRSRKIRSDRSKGVKRMVKVGMLVTDDTVEEILHRVKKASSQLAGYRIWMATTIMSSLGPEIVGSGGRMLRSDHPLAFKFQVESHDSTGVWSTELGMLTRLEDMLDKWAGNEHQSVIYLHSVLVHHFTRIR
jgi:hypothetical protein